MKPLATDLFGGLGGWSHDSANNLIRHASSRSNSRKSARNGGVYCEDVLPKVTWRKT